MNFLVEKILELATRKANEPDEEDFVDLDMDQPDGGPYQDSDECHVNNTSYSQTNRLYGPKPDFADDPKHNTCSC